ncbi:MAG: hydrogenase maturation protease, partial [Candidatus Heimdallarchaeota archaeon]
LLLKDEGFGIHIIKAIEKLQLPNIEIHDIGRRNILGVIFALNGCDKGIIIDAVKRGGEPGTVYRFKLEEEVKAVDIIKRIRNVFSLHQLDLSTAISMGRESGLNLPRGNIVVIGVEPKIIEAGLELSPEVKKVVPRVIDLVIQDVNRINR